jgi:hypothetical protein
LLKQHGSAIFILASVPGVRRCKALQAELVQPRQLPDGLLEVLFRGQKKPDQVLVEVATYPEKRVLQQVSDDLKLASLHLHKLPDLVTLVLCPKGQFRLTGRHEERSPLGWCKETVEWKVVELWELDAEPLLTVEDAGVLPWAVLTRYAGPPEALLKKCRERIEQLARPSEQTDLLAVAQVLARLRFKDPELLALLGGRRVMMESPLIKEIQAETRQEDILRLLENRFGTIPLEITSHLRKILSEKKLKALFDYACVCPHVEAFRDKLLS